MTFEEEFPFVQSVGDTALARIEDVSAGTLEASFMAPKTPPPRSTAAEDHKTTFFSRDFWRALPSSLSFPARFNSRLSFFVRLFSILRIIHYISWRFKHHVLRCFPASTILILMNNYLKLVFSRKVINLKSVSVLAVVIIASLAFIYRGLFIAATVNGSFISRLSIIRSLEKQSGKAVLDGLITEKLFEGEAQRRGISVSQEEIDAVLKNIEEQVKAQGTTLDQALAMRSMTKEDLITQIISQKKLEKMLADKAQVSEADIDAYIADNKLTPPKGQEADFRKSAGNQLRQQKLATEADALIANLRETASIGRFAGY